MGTALTLTKFVFCVGSRNLKYPVELTFFVSLSKQKFIFPTLPRVNIEQALDRGAQGSATQSIPGFMFHTGICMPNVKTGENPKWYNNFLDHFRLAMPDTRVGFFHDTTF